MFNVRSPTKTSIIILFSSVPSLKQYVLLHIQNKRNDIIMEFKTDEGKTFTSNFDNAAINFIMNCRLISGSCAKRTMIPFPFTAEEIQTIDDIFYDEIKNEPTLLQHIKEYHEYSKNDSLEYSDELDGNIEEIKDLIYISLSLNWELCEELFGGTGEALILEDGSVSADTFGVFDDTVLFYFAYLAKIDYQDSES